MERGRRRLRQWTDEEVSAVKPSPRLMKAAADVLSIASRICADRTATASAGAAAASAASAAAAAAACSRTNGSAAKSPSVIIFLLAYDIRPHRSYTDSEHPYHASVSWESW